MLGNLQNMRRTESAHGSILDRRHPVRRFASTEASTTCTSVDLYRYGFHVAIPRLPELCTPEPRQD